MTGCKVSMPEPPPMMPAILSVPAGGCCAWSGWVTMWHRPKRRLIAVSMPFRFADMQYRRDIGDNGFAGLMPVSLFSDSLKNKQNTNIKKNK